MGGPRRWDSSSRKKATRSGTESDLERHDYGLLCAYTHPDCDGAELDLITDWYVWVFYFDDHFLELYKRTKDTEAAQEHLTGCGRSCRLTTRSRARPCPSRLTQSRPAWPTCGRAPFPPCPSPGGAGSPSARGTCSTNRCGSSPISARGGSRTRSSTSRCAARWAARPGRPTSSSTRRAPRCLRLGRDQAAAGAGDTFSDAVHLRNDIFSYQRETEEEGELNNGVLVFETVLRPPAPGGRRRAQRPADLPAAAVRAHRGHRVARALCRARRRPGRAGGRPGLRQGPCGLAIGRTRVAPAVKQVHERRGRTGRSRRPWRADWDRHVGRPGSRARVPLA